MLVLMLQIMCLDVGCCNYVQVVLYCFGVVQFQCIGNQGVVDGDFLYVWYVVQENVEVVVVQIVFGIDVQVDFECSFGCGCEISQYVVLVFVVEGVCKGFGVEFDVVGVQFGYGGYGCGVWVYEEVDVYVQVVGFLDQWFEVFGVLWQCLVVVGCELVF